MRSFAEGVGLLLALGGWVSSFAQQQQQVITLERPMYSLRIEAPGTIVYTGHGTVAAAGMRTAPMDPDTFRYLIEEFERIHFFDLKDQYRSRTVGNLIMTTPYGSLTYIGLHQGGKAKTITDSYGYAPRELMGLEYLIEREANVHRWLHDETTSLSLDSPESGSEIAVIEDLKSLWTVTVDCAGRTKPGMTSLMQAAGQGDVEGVRRALASGDSVNAVDETGWTALMLAAAATSPEIVSLLVQAGARVDQRDGHGDTALIAAVAIPFARSPISTARVAVVRTLLAHGAAVEAANNLGETALMWAAKSGRAEETETLLRAGANVRRADRAGRDAFFYARREVSRIGNSFFLEPYQRTLAILEHGAAAVQ